MSDDWSTPEERRAQRKLAREAKERIAADDAILQTIMARTDGRAWMYDLLAFCQVFSSTFTGEALSSAFSEGRRTVGLRVFSDVMRACPDAYVQMMREANATRSDDRNTTDADAERIRDEDE